MIVVITNESSLMNESSMNDRGLVDPVVFVIKFVIADSEQLTKHFTPMHIVWLFVEIKILTIL